MTREYTTLSRWVRNETIPHASLLTRMREKLTAALDPRTELDHRGRPMIIPADVTPAGAPNREWARGYQQYKDGFKVLVEEQRERDKMILMARNKSQTPMSEDEYAEGMAQMMAEAVAMLSREDLLAELAKRGMQEPA